MDLLQLLRTSANAEGFALLGIAPAVGSDGFDNLVRWIEFGYAGQMHYFAERLDAYRHPESVLEGARSIVVMTFPYAASNFGAVPSGHGRIARYAWSDADYHDFIHPKLKRICRLITDTDRNATARGVVDTAPLAEREVAELAGIGWRGKNTLLLNKSAGSYFFLACVLTSVVLPCDQPHASDHCGTCTACLQACPTDAFPQPGVLDATRCISYLTIEHRDPIDVDLRAQMGDWVFGCDVCQEVCPWNRKPSRRAERPSGKLESIDLRQLMTISDEAFRQRFRHTPMWRPRRRGMLRNAAIVLGNEGDERSVQALIAGLNDLEPLVRGASAWALGRIGNTVAIEALKLRQKIESDSQVIGEIKDALV